MKKLVSLLLLLMMVWSCAAADELPRMEKVTFPAIPVTHGGNHKAQVGQQRKLGNLKIKIIHRDHVRGIFVAVRKPLGQVLKYNFHAIPSSVSSYFRRLRPHIHTL